MPGTFLYWPNPPDVLGAVIPVASEVISLLLVRILHHPLNQIWKLIIPWRTALTTYNIVPWMLFCNTRFFKNFKRQCAFSLIFSEWIEKLHPIYFHMSYSIYKRHNSTFEESKFSATKFYFFVHIHHYWQWISEQF